MNHPGCIPNVSPSLGSVKNGTKSPSSSAKKSRNMVSPFTSVAVRRRHSPSWW